MNILRRNLNLILILIIPSISFILGLITIKDYGINWDEPYHYRRGQAFLHYYLTGKKTYEGLPSYPALKGTTDTPGFRNSDELFNRVQKNPNFSDPSFRRSYYQSDSWNGEFFIDEEGASGHPPLNGILASLSNYIFYQKLNLLGDLESYHLFILSIVSLATFLIAIFVWMEFGVIESIFTSLALSSYPLLLGEQHFNIKDPVETAFYAITIISAYLGIKRNKLSWLLISALFFALALSTKFNIVFSIIALGLWFLHYRSELWSKGKLTKNIGITLLISPLIVLGIFFLSFPTLWRDPLGGLMQVVNFYLGVGFSDTQPSNYYFGFINTYPFLWIIYTTPPIVLVLSLLGLINIRGLIKNSSFTFLVILWLLITVGRISFFGASSYGGVRLIMEYIPALSIFTGISAGYIIKKQKAKYLALVTAIILAGFIPTLIKLRQIHPNENVYFNFLVGGLPGAKEKNLDSWGNSYGNAYFPAISWLNQNGEENSKLTLPVNSIVNIPRYKLRSDIALSNDYWSGPRHEGEYVIELTHDYEPKDWYSLKYLETVLKPIYEVKVEGVAIAKLWKNDQEFVKDEYKDFEKIKVKLNIDKAKNRLTISLAKVEKLMLVSVKIPTEGCEPILTGYARTSVDNLTWSREPEDIARDQLKQAKLRGISETFDFYFVAKEAKAIVFETENSDACLLKAASAVASVLQDH